MLYDDKGPIGWRGIRVVAIYLNLGRDSKSCGGWYAGYRYLSLSEASRHIISWEMLNSTKYSNPAWEQAVACY